MISKESFVKAINAIKERSKEEDKLCEALGVEGIITYGDQLLDTLIKVLVESFSLAKEFNVIEWWIYDAEYGKSAIIHYTDNGNKEELHLSTPELLYDYILTLN